MRKNFRLFPAFAFILVFLAVILPGKVFAVDTCEGNAPVLITGVQAGISYHPYDEYVELYNCTDAVVDLGGYALSLQGDSGTDIASVTFADGTFISPGGFLLVANEYYAEYLSLLSSSQLNLPIFYEKVNGVGADGGYIILTDNDGLAVNEVTYGLADASSAPKPPSDQSIKRCTNASIFADSGNDSQDFSVTTLPTLSYLFSYGPPCENSATDNNGDNGNSTSGTGGGQGNNGDNTGGDNTSEEDPGAVQNDCAGIVISELLPNPAGSDGGHEFIELHNTTDKNAVLNGCKLQTTANSKIFEFSSAYSLKPGEYKAFYDAETGLTLQNSGGGKVYFIDSNNIENGQDVNYPSGLDDDVSWSLINGNWASTFSVTPDKPNELLTQKPLAPCPAGQFRNQDTNRCNNIAEEASSLMPCAPGKERNPETHRCRNIISLTSTLTACAAGQYRNPATNRCRKYSQASTLKPCDPGQERNPATHRCRKINAVSSAGDGINDVKDVLSADTQAGTSDWSFALFSVVGAFSYGLWEWRNEILQKLYLLRTKFS